MTDLEILLWYVGYLDQLARDNAESGRENTAQDYLMMSEVILDITQHRNGKMKDAADMIIVKIREAYKL